ncbi:hypothetical protein D3C81_1650290 [compost metagenome]
MAARYLSATSRLAGNSAKPSRAKGLIPALSRVMAAFLSQSAPFLNCRLNSSTPPQLRKLPLQASSHWVLNAPSLRLLSSVSTAISWGSGAMMVLAARLLTLSFDQ